MEQLNYEELISISGGSQQSYTKGVMYGQMLRDTLSTLSFFAFFL